MKFFFVAVVSLVSAAAFACDDDDARAYDLLFVSGSSLYAVRDDGSDLRLLYEGQPSVPAFFSPDGEWVAVGCADDGSASLPWTTACVERVDGSERLVVQLTPPVDGGFLRRADWDAGAIAWSQDSERIAFTVVEEITPDVFTDGDLYTYDLETGTSRLLDEGKAASTRLWLRWSPDGKYIASARTATVGPGSVLQIIDTADGTSVVAGSRLGDGLIEMYAWAPNSESIVFTWNDFSGTVGLYRTDPANVEPELIGEAWGGETPAWSPDSNWIAASRVPGGTGFAQVFVMRADGRDEQPVAEGFFLSQAPEWDLDGGRLIFFGSEEPAASASSFPPSGYYVVASSGGTPRRLTGSQNLGLYSIATWSPDGERVFYAAEPEQCMEGCPLGRLFMVKVDEISEPVSVSGGVTVTEIIGWVER